ncbi:MAG: peptide-methionine (S)-S-oxide reductase MsrA [Clostridium sp.]|nr:peptide-methionine (S)-S-oxide reductase MsrA [Clostridium sp.]
MKKIILAGGCFWGVQSYFNSIEGVMDTRTGYVNGKADMKNPTYEEVCKNTTGYAEACYIEYNEKVLSCEKLLEAYWKVVDPTIMNRQGGDKRTQYRTGIYYIEHSDKEVIESSKEMEQKKYKATIVTEIAPLKNFYDAEEYHQKYLEKHPDGYCHIPKELFKK